MYTPVSIIVYDESSTCSCTCTCSYTHMSIIINRLQDGIRDFGAALQPMKLEDWCAFIKSNRRMTPVVVPSHCAFTLVLVDHVIHLMQLHLLC